MPSVHHAPKVRKLRSARLLLRVVHQHFGPEVALEAEGVIQGIITEATAPYMTDLSLTRAAKRSAVDASRSAREALGLTKRAEENSRGA